MYETEITHQHEGWKDTNPSDRETPHLPDQNKDRNSLTLVLFQPALLSKQPQDDQPPTSPWMRWRPLQE